MKNFRRVLSKISSILLVSFVILGTLCASIAMNTEPEVTDRKDLQVPFKPHQAHAYEVTINGRTVYCMHHGDVLGGELYIGGNLIKEDDFVTFGVVESEQLGEVEASTGYAMWLEKVLGEDHQAVQITIWNSKDFDANSNVVSNNSKTEGRANTEIQQRAMQYGYFYHGIVKNLNGELFKNVTNKDNLKVMVNQDDRTYTVGPYKIALNVNSTNQFTQEGAEYLYKELLKQNNYYKDETAWANFDDINNIIKGLNGTGAQFLDKSGKVIEFPDFTKNVTDGVEFYIRFKPANDGEIAETGEPEINVEYFKKFNAYRGVYYPSTDDTYIFNNASISAGQIKNVAKIVSIHGVPSTQEVSDGTSMVKFTGYATVQVPMEVRNNKYSGHKYIETLYNFPVYAYSTSYTTVGHDNNNDGIDDYYTRVFYKPGDGAFELTGSITQSFAYGDQEFPGLARTIQEVVTLEYSDYEKAKTKVKFNSVKINMVLGGHVWLEGESIKTAEYDGKYTPNSSDKDFAGMQVSLYDVDKGQVVRCATTDVKGLYRFVNLNPMHRYKVLFLYNGELYEPTTLNPNIAKPGGVSNANDDNREAFNKKFANIYPDASNYTSNKGTGNRAYGLEQRIRGNNDDYISFNGDALRYKDIWEEFLKESTGTMIDGDVYTKHSKEQSYNYQALNTLGANSSESAMLKQYIEDCMIQATSTTNKISDKCYPEYKQFVLEDLENEIGYKELDDLRSYSIFKYLYTTASDQSKYVDFGIKERLTADLALQKDVYKAQVIVNGKQHTYIYNKKQLDDDGVWNIETRAADALYNGSARYNREVRSSEYLYNGPDYGTTDKKNLQVYVTYRIAVKNQGQVDTKVNEIVDYYDASQYEYDGTLNGNTYQTKVRKEYDSNGNVTGQGTTSYVGAGYAGERLAGKELTVKNTGIDGRQETVNGLSTIYIQGMCGTQGNDMLKPGELAYIYVTFKVKNDPTTGRIMLDQDITTGAYKSGKRNIAEVNSYYTKEGIVDIDSTAGSLSERDFNADGDIISSRDPVQNRLEDDTDKAPNMRIIINQDDIRTFNGYVFEDDRTVNNDQAQVGDGLDNNETKVNGVTIELVELVSDVDEDGIFTGSYSQGEKVWYSEKYEVVQKDVPPVTDMTRYFSGSGHTKVILSGPEGTILNVPVTEIADPAGRYSLVSIPAGDFFIRFTYGDTTQTVLMTEEGAKENAQSKAQDKNREAEMTVNELVGESGLNAKSYNGQDYKSTVYQAGVDQSSSYNGINGYTNYDGQNYSSADGATLNNGTDKSSMYVYDVAKAEDKNVSDAKDVLYYRNKVNNYSKNLLNNRAEILDSFETISTYKGTSNDELVKIQRNMLSELMENTKMVAQTGIIDTEVEYNRTTTGNQGLDNQGTLDYVMNDITLGLVERPRAQLILGKEVANFKLVLANNQVLFDASQSVNNLYYAKHTSHQPKFDNIRLNGVLLSKNSKATPELIQAVMDDELMEGSRIDVTYKYTVRNVSEVDYLDNQFYYTGKTNNASAENIAKTSANTVIDYLANTIKYNKGDQDATALWTLRSPDYLTASRASRIDPSNFDLSMFDKDYVNRSYYDTISTYNSILTTDKLGGELLPETASRVRNSDKYSTSSGTTLVVSTLVSVNNGADNLVYNNLAELIDTSNTVGRRMYVSIAGNQQMADQDAGNNAAESVYTRVDLVTPDEADADSAQKIVLIPPTGENREYTPIMIALVIAAGLMIASVLVIRKTIVNGK